MEIIFNKVYIMDNIWLFCGYMIAIILIIIFTAICVKKEIRNKK